MSRQGPPVLVNERVLWLGCGSGLPRTGVIKWIGYLPEIGPDWTVGLELDDALPVGGIDGTWGGRVLFTCKSKHGLLVPVSSVVPGSHLKLVPSSTNFGKNQNAAVPIHSKTTLSRHQQAVALHPLLLQPERTTLKYKRKIATPPSSSDCNQARETETATLRVDELGQDSLKKRLRLFVESNGATKMNGVCNDYTLQEVVIDSLYAQRHQQFVKHGRSQSESNRAFISSTRSSSARRDRNSTSAIFSFFRWFRKDSRDDEFDAEFAPSAPSSPQLVRGLSTSCGSVDTLFSTATASSFSFVHPALYRPFGAANAPEKRILPGPDTETYRNRLRQRDRIRELDKHLTLKKKYRLFGSDTLHRSADDVYNKCLFINKSLDSIKSCEVDVEHKTSTLGRKKRKAPQPPPLEVENSQACILFNQFDNNKDNTEIKTNPIKSAAQNNKPRHRRTASDSSKDRKSGSFVHVKGKRKAPPPPGNTQGCNSESNEHQEILGTQSLGRKKRPAPPTPLEVQYREKTKNKLCLQNYLSPEEKQKLIENIAKLQAHADRRSLFLPSPPESPSVSTKMSHAVCNDSLKLERGVLKANKTEVQSAESKSLSPTPVSPRPWYKRNNKEKSLEKRKGKKKNYDWMPEVAIVRGSTTNHDANNCVTSSSSNSGSYRLSNIFSRFEKPEEKRKSQISILANISELDREAAEIVQREQEKERAVIASHDAKYYTSDEQVTNFSKSGNFEANITQNIPMINNTELPRRSGAQELISLFNALGNVTKVTVNSAFSREGSNMFAKERKEESISISMDSEANRTSRHPSNSNDFKRETIIVETRETYLESPGIKRRQNIVGQTTKENDCSGIGASRVTIEEIEEDMEEPKLQIQLEAKIVKKQNSPAATGADSITAIADTNSTVNSKEIPTVSSQSPSELQTPMPATSSTVLAAVLPEPPKPSNNYSIWSCPRCTLENPRWRVTCEACDMWRPAVRKDVIDKLTNTNMGSTIAVNGMKVDGIKNSNPISQLSNKKNNVDMYTEQNSQSKTKVIRIENDAKLEDNRSKPITVSGLLCSSSYKPTESIISHGTPSKMSNNNYSKASNYLPRQSSDTTNSFNVTQNKSVCNEPNTRKPKESSKPKAVTVQSEPEIEELRTARLAFFKKYQSDEKSQQDKNDKKPNTTSKAKACNSKIDALFSIASKGSLATNDEERLKVKEILKEMKDSLPKKSNQISSKSGGHKSDVINSEMIRDDVQRCIDPARLGAIRKSTVPTTTQQPSNVNKSLVSNNKDSNKTELYFVKSETVIEEIKVKGTNDQKCSKVSTAVQTNGVIRKVEPTLSVTKNEEPRLVTGKPPTPKATRKDFTVPTIVEDHVVKDGTVYTTTVTNEPRKMSIGAFELIRPRDFATIEATKTSKKANILPHVYANVPSTHVEYSITEPTSSLLSNNRDIKQWTDTLSKPKGLADFKAAVLESTAGDKMSTLAVNRLLKQLEVAIVGGQHERAATLAQELARHKVSCSVIRHQRTNNDIILDMYVEDMLSHQGPFPLRVLPTVTVAELKSKVEQEFEIPVLVQRWILGKQLAVDDKATLQQLGVSTTHCPVFLYLVAPDGANEKPVGASVVDGDNASSANGAEAVAVTCPNQRTRFFNEQDDRYSLCDSEISDHSSKASSPGPDVAAASGTPMEKAAAAGPLRDVGVVDEVVTEERDQAEEVEIEEAAAAMAVKPEDEIPSTDRFGTLSKGWKCHVCTLVNAPTRPGCLACAADRPVDYIVPLDHEKRQLDNDLRTEQAEAEEKRKNYEQLVVLENADLITSTEPFECSVCLAQHEAGEGVILRDCLHVFCRGCLAHTVQYTDDAEVKCPFRDHNYACDSTLQEREIKAVCEEDDTCIVCMAEPRCCALTPCGHRSYCETCCLRLIELGQLCSLCRRPADGYLVIYL